VTSPGAKDSILPLAWARSLRIPVVDEIEIGFRYCPAKIVAVTGTNGKSTTTTLIGDILKAGDIDAVVCGNIGYSFCEKVLGLTAASVVVLEVSSFQLQRTVMFRPQVALFLNLTRNHLDRHADLDEYLQAKMKIFANQKRSDWAILNNEDKVVSLARKKIAAKVIAFGRSAAINGAFCKDRAIYLHSGDELKRFISADELALPGDHNIDNAMAALLVGQIFGLKPETIRRALKHFKGLEHRFEAVDEIRGVRFINDSKATTVDAALKAINSVTTPVILIAGGRDKGSDFTPLRAQLSQKLRAVILIGEAKEKIRTQLMGALELHDASSLDHAVALGLEIARKGETVLLSPMCASFDMFRNFEERGEYFKKAVHSLKKTVAATADAAGAV
ncbi:MAG: UDP-N-acetylmuramoyl-L-alanine--D-glutamate ligase, partial [Candidatus Omnitrophota bacterium]